MKKIAIIEKLIKITLPIFIVPGIIIIAGCSVPHEIKEMTIIMPELEKSKDGRYRGNYDSKMVRAEVVVKLRDHSITDIKLVKHDTGLGKKAETLVDSVMHYQTIELDAVTGATASSRVILKSIESALIKSIN